MGSRDDMYIKLLFIILIVGLAACSERDLPFYQANLKEAEVKYYECKLEAQEAGMAFDRDKMMEVIVDPECKAATKAVSKYRQAKEALEYERREEERMVKLEKQRLVFSQEYEAHINTMLAMDIESFYEIDKVCGRGLSFKSTAQCKAFYEVKKARVNTELYLLIEKYSGNKLAEFSKKQCKGIGYNEMYCRLSRDAIKKRWQDEVEYYLENRGAMKTAFNKCQSKYTALKDLNKRIEAREYIKTFQCSTVSDAAKKLKVYNFSEPIG